MGTSRCARACAFAAIAAIVGCEEVSDGAVLTAPGGLLLDYTFDERQGNIVHDSSGLDPALDLHIEAIAAVEWAPQGLRMLPGGVLRSQGRTDRIVESVQETGALTVEVWIDDTGDTEDGKLIEFGQEGVRNFWLKTLRHADGTLSYEFRVRMGGELTGRTAIVDVPDRTARHIVFARGDNGLVTLYLDGAATSTSELPGTFDTWSLFYDLEVGRGFLGTYQRLSVFNRALSDDDVIERYAAGP